MAEEKRKHLRTPINMELRITFHDNTVGITKTWDISDGGIGIHNLSEYSDYWEIGTAVKAKVMGLPFDSPELDMEVVRIEEDRIGLKIVQHPPVSD